MIISNNKAMCTLNVVEGIKFIMKLIDNFREYMINNEFVINIYQDKINIINYTSIGAIEDTKIVVNGSNKNVLISGEKLALKKLLNDEILISGVIKKIELR